MKKTVLTSFTILCLLSTVFLIGLAFNVQTVEASGTIYIRADGSIEGTTHISTVDNVTYTFTDDIYDISDTFVERDNIVVDGAGYTLQGTGSGDEGFVLSNINNVSIINVNIKGFHYAGITLLSSSNNRIIGNNITAVIGHGIVFYSSSNNSIIENNITNNNNGVWLYDSSNNNSIAQNTFVNGGLTVSYSYGNMVENNLVNGKPLVYFEGVSDRVVENAGQVVLVNCTRIRVENLELSKTTVGVELWGTNNTKITESNIIASSVHGIMLYYSSNNSITRNNITASNQMTNILLYSSSNNTLAGNNLTNNGLGIRLEYDSSNNEIIGNNVAKNTFGIALVSRCSNNNIIGNNVTAISCGILINSYSNNNSIVNNNIANSSNGIRLLWSSNYNRIFHNNLQENGEHASTKESNNNFWDDGYPSGGNYWSDYTVKYPDANEIDDSGIWDTPYVINLDNIDQYPLMAPPDITPPTLSVFSPENKTYPGNNVSLTFTVSETTDWIGYSLDGQANVTITGNKTLSVLSDGLHSLIVYANDTAGNMGASEMFHFTIETQQEEAFPTWLVAIIVIIVVFGVALLVYFTKVRKTTEKT